MYKRFLGRSLLVVTIICGVAVLPAAAISLYTAWYLMVPRYSAVAEVPQYGFNARLDLFLSDDEARDSGRHVTFITGGQYHIATIPGWDWPHRARTSLYRIDDNHLAVLSAQGHDLKVTLTPFDTAPLTSGSGEGWEYLGAFDFTFPSGEKPRLAFFVPGQLAECIPMGNDNTAAWAKLPRAAARRATCPTSIMPID